MEVLRCHTALFESANVDVGINFTAILNKRFPRFTIVIVNMRNC